MTPIESRGWSSPSFGVFLISPIVLTLQASLLTPGITLPHLDGIRKYVLPIALYTIWSNMDPFPSSFFRPEKDFILLNTVIQIAKAWSILRSIELAFAPRVDYVWIGYEKAYASEKKEGKNDEKDKTKTQEKPSIGRSLVWGWCLVSNFRGIGWSWGIQGSQIPQPHPKDWRIIPSLLFRVIWTHLLTISGIALATLCRQKGSGSLVLQDTFNLSSLNPRLLYHLEEAINVYSFGAAIYATLECGYTVLTLFVYLLTPLLRSILPSNLKPNPFDPRAWPRVMKAPYRSTSLHEFWGKRWHSVFRRLFQFIGFDSGSNLAKNMGEGKSGRMVAGLVGAFATSGIMHEAFNHATPWYPRDRLFRTFLFFLVQSLGLIAESVFTKSFGRRVSGFLGLLWTFGFLLYTGRLMKDCWVDRGLADFLPPVNEWEWWRWYIPFGVIFPTLSRPEWQ